MAIERKRRFRERQAGQRAAFVAGDPYQLLPSVLRRHIIELTCPWCDDGPFRHLGAHLWMAHGVLSRDFKAAAMVPLDTALVDTAVSERLREHAEEHRDTIIATLSAHAEPRRAWIDPTPLMLMRRAAMVTAMRADLVRDALAAPDLLGHTRRGEDTT